VLQDTVVGDMPPGHKLRLAILAVIALNGIGAIGYRLIEGWPWLDCFYMTFITLATIGFAEVRRLSPMGRVFTMLLFWTTAGVLAIAITTAGQSLLQSELVSTLGRKRRMFRDITKLRSHFIVCGVGRVGRYVVQEMERRSAKFVIIEKEPECAERFLEQGHLVLIGDASDEEVLKEAGVGDARGIVCCLPTDAENVYVALTARGLNQSVYIVARANEEAAISKLRKAGADRVVSPAIIGSHRMAQTVLSPAVSDFIELATMAEGLDLTIEQLEVGHDSTLVGMKLKDSGIRQDYDVIIIAIKRGEEKMLFNPSGETEMSAGDVLVAVGALPELERLTAKANPGAAAVRWSRG
jgi:voltage-gated potassium channel